MENEFAAIFHKMHPGFFEQEYIKKRPAEIYSDEMLLDLAEFDKDKYVIEVPEHVTFGFYKGNMEMLKNAVAQVDETWVQFFRENSRVYRATIGSEIASFCLIDNFGIYSYADRIMKFGGPGCVGTVPKFRRQGIGLKMVLEVTQILKEEGYDMSYIHYTSVAPWYAKLGYRTVLRWNCNGLERQ
ncbi:MAG: GNAT family N-acetyltransferase [Lachnospiraceae bacterium]